MRSIVDYSRGAIFILFGLFFFFFDKFNIEGIEYKPWYKFIGVLFLFMVSGVVTGVIKRIITDDQVGHYETGCIGWFCDYYWM
jgi:hypothetical protein